MGSWRIRTGMDAIWGVRSNRSSPLEGYLGGEVPHHLIAKSGLFPQGDDDAGGQLREVRALDIHNVGIIILSGWAGIPVNVELPH